MTKTQNDLVSSTRRIPYPPKENRVLIAQRPERKKTYNPYYFWKQVSEMDSFVVAWQLPMDAKAIDNK